MRLPITADVLSARGHPVYPTGATQPPLRVQFTDADGTPVNLASPARCVVKVRRHGADEITERRGDVPRDTASEGIVEYQLTEADTATEGLLNLCMIVETTTGEEWVLPTDEPINVSVRHQLD